MRGVRWGQMLSSGPRGVGTTVGTWLQHSQSLVLAQLEALGGIYVRDPAPAVVQQRKEQGVVPRIPSTGPPGYVFVRAGRPPASTPLLWDVCPVRPCEEGTPQTPQPFPAGWGSELGCVRGHTGQNVRQGWAES